MIIPSARFTIYE